MKTAKSIVTFLMTAALLGAPAAHALLLTTWTLPSNAEALEAEYAASTNVVTVLELTRSLNGEAVSILYRKASGTMASAMCHEEEFRSKVRIVQNSAAGGLRATATTPMEVHASDGPDNYKDGEGHFADSWLGGPESEGWNGGWKVIGDSATPEAGFTTGGKMSLTMTAASGETVVGRDLEAPVASGYFSVAALLDAGDSFRGFAVYDGETELIRWGVGVDVVKEQGGFGYSLDKGASYTFFATDMPGGDVVDTYSMTWAQLSDGSGMKFTLEGAYWDTPYTVPDIVAATQVSTVALFAVADTQDFNNEIAFTSVSAGGTPVSAVPEPGTVGLLAAGAAVLWAKRRTKRG